MLDRRAFMQLALTGAWAISLGACGGSGAGDAPVEGGGEEQQGQGNATGMPNPFVDCDSAYDAAQLAGFEVTFPESVPDCSERRYQAVEGQMVQCIYQGDGQEVLIRKGLDDGTGDLSGDYNDYPQTVSTSVNCTEVTLRGSDNLVNVATWERDGYLFALDADTGLERATVENLVSATL